MTSNKALRSTIINKLWSYTTTDAKRSPDFHKWLEELILSDRKELLQEILEVAEKEDSYNDVIQAITNYKIK